MAAGDEGIVCVQVTLGIGCSISNIHVQYDIINCVYETLIIANNGFNY